MTVVSFSGWNQRIQGSKVSRVQGFLKTHNPLSFYFFVSFWTLCPLSSIIYLLHFFHLFLVTVTHGIVSLSNNHRQFLMPIKLIIHNYSPVKSLPSSSRLFPFVSGMMNNTNSSCNTMNPAKNAKIGQGLSPNIPFSASRKMGVTWISGDQREAERNIHIYIERESEMPGRSIIMRYVIEKCFIEWFKHMNNDLKLRPGAIGWPQKHQWLSVLITQGPNATHPHLLIWILSSSKSPYSA